MTKGPLQTRLCDLLGIRYPILQAGMGAAASPELTVAVSNAGGLGVIGGSGSRMNAERLAAAIRHVKQATDRPFGVDLVLPAAFDIDGKTRRPEGPRRAELPVAQTEFIDKLRQKYGLAEVADARAEDAPPGDFHQSPRHVRDLIDVVLQSDVPILAFGLGTPEWLVKEAHLRGMLTISLVGKARAAEQVVSYGTDVVVAQGYDGGGHTGPIGTVALVPQVVDAVGDRVPVVAAGGIMDGRGLAAALALGATGVWCGSLFLATPEAYTSRFHKQAVVDGDADSTRISKVYTGKTARVVVNEVVTDWEQSRIPTLPMPLQGLLMRPLNVAALRARRHDLIMNPAGQGIGLVHAVRPASEIVEEMARDAIATLERLGGNVG